jgi:translation elongation factor EF-1alpha
VFQKLAPHETFFLQPTSQIDNQQINTNDNIYFNVVDFPGNYVLKNDLQRQISQCGALIYVIDAQSQEYDSACVKLKELI